MPALKISFTKPPQNFIFAYTPSSEGVFRPEGGFLDELTLAAIKRKIQNAMKCLLLKDRDADHRNSHIISHFILNETLSDSDGINRNRGIIFQIGKPTGVAYEYGNEVLEEKISQSFNETVDKTIEKNARLTSFPHLYSKEAEKLMSDKIESHCSGIWKKLRQGAELRSEEKEELYNLLVLHVMRLGHANYDQIDLNESWLDSAEDEVTEIIEGRKPVGQKFVFQVLNWKKESKTSGLFITNSLTQKIKYLIFDDVIIIARLKSENAVIIELFAGIEKFLDLNQSEYLTVNPIDDENCEIISRLIQNKIQDQHKDMLLKLAKFCLARFGGVYSIDEGVLKGMIYRTLIAPSHGIQLNDVQFAYLFTTINGVCHRNREYEKNLFGRIVDDYHVQN